MHLAQKYFAVQESSCVQYLEMHFITNSRNGTINISVILKLLKCKSVCDVNLCFRPFQLTFHILISKWYKAITCIFDIVRSCFVKKKLTKNNDAKAFYLKHYMRKKLYVLQNMSCFKTYAVYNKSKKVSSINILIF